MPTVGSPKPMAKKHCGLCGNRFPLDHLCMNHWCCHPCQRDYVAFRRAWKKEHGRFPKIGEFRK